MISFFKQKDILEDLKVEDETLKHNPLECCSVCKYALHDVNLGDRDEVVCIYSFNNPALVKIKDICPNFKTKYNNLKLIENKGFLAVYDTEKIRSVNSIPDLQEIGEDEWLEKSSASVAVPTLLG